MGVLLSSFIQVFLSEKVIQRWFPKNALLGMLFALVCGFCLPVCDCATIPMFKSLIKKGVPTSSAVVFMVATPVINPVVILSTYYALMATGKLFWQEFYLNDLRYRHWIYFYIQTNAGVLFCNKLRMQL